VTATDTISEDRIITGVGFVFARRPTATSSGEESAVWTIPVMTQLRRATADFLAVVVRPRVAEPTELALGDFAASILPLTAVVAVTHAEDHGVHLVWSFIRTRDKSLRKEIYARERALMAKYRDLVFDFNVVALDQADAGALVPDDLQGRVVMYRNED
jgi:hypothetical protein